MADRRGHTGQSYGDHAIDHRTSRSTGRLIPPWQSSIPMGTGSPDPWKTATARVSPPRPGLPWRRSPISAGGSWARPRLNGPTDTLTMLYSLAQSGDFHKPAELNPGGTGLTDNTVLSNALQNYNPWSGLGSPVANLLIPDLAGGKNTIGGTLTNSRTAGQPGLANWTVFLDLNGDGVLEPGEASTTTNAQGNYRFLVAPGDYSVRVVIPQGWKQTTPNPAEIMFAPGQSHQKTGVNFSNARN